MRHVARAIGDDASRAGSERGDFPDFAHQKAAQAMVLACQEESAVAESGAMVRERAPIESSEQAEGAVKSGYERACEEAAKCVFGDCEFREYPHGARCDGLPQITGEHLNFVGCEAIEDEVADDEIVPGPIVLTKIRPPVADVSPMGLNPCGVRSGAAKKCVEHRRACVDGVDLDFGIRPKQASNESAVAVAEYESPPALCERGKKCAAAQLKPRAETGPLHPAVDRGEGIEIRSPAGSLFDAHLRTRSGRARRMAGVRSARSAAMRRVTGVRRLRRRSSKPSKNAASAPHARSSAMEGRERASATAKNVATEPRAMAGEMIERCAKDRLRDSQRSMAQQLSHARDAKIAVAMSSGQKAAAFGN